MKSKVQLWGNSLALRIPKFIAKQIKVTNGSEVEISLEGEKIIIKPAEDKYSLDEFLKRINQQNIHEEKEFGEPLGGEIW
jgi:antitoxin MazE